MDHNLGFVSNFDFIHFHFNYSSFTSPRHFFSYMPVIPFSWMESSQWQQEPRQWASTAYDLLAPRINVRGRMALLLLVGVIWAFSWLLWRAYTVLQTSNDVLVEKLGLDIPPLPLLTLEEISAGEIQISWKLYESSTSISEYRVEVNGLIAGTTKKTETVTTISNLRPGNLYDIRVFSSSPSGFVTPSSFLHVRVPPSAEPLPQDGITDTFPIVRAFVPRVPPPPPIPAPVAPAMVREPSAGQTISRRGTTGRKPSPAGHIVESATPPEIPKPIEDESDGDLADLSKRFQKVQSDIDAAEAQIIDEEREFEAQVKDYESRRDELKKDLKERDEASNELKKQVHKAESASRTAQSERSKKERLLQQKESQRQKRQEEIARWEEQISSMTEEVAGIGTQKAAIERRTQIEIREVRKRIEEEQREVSILEDENKEKAMTIKGMEEDRQNSGTDLENEESREADQVEHERELRWQERFSNLNATYARIWNDLQQAQQHYTIARDRLALSENMRRIPTVAFVPGGPLDLDPTRRGLKTTRRVRPPGSLGSSISSPRGAFGTEQHLSASHVGNPVATSPTTYGPSFFNPQNGMTLVIPGDHAAPISDEVETVASMPMSPRADALLPADLLGDDDSVNDIDEQDLPLPEAAGVADLGMTPFPRLGSPRLAGDVKRSGTPSTGSSSRRSFSSPRETFAPVRESEEQRMLQNDEDVPLDQAPMTEETHPSSRKLTTLFSFSRQRGKNSIDQTPTADSLNADQRLSFPGEPDGIERAPGSRRKLSHGGSWAFPGSLLAKEKIAGEKDGSGRFPTSKRTFPSLLPGFGKSATSAPFDPFASRNHPYDPTGRGENSSPRPSSVYSFDRLPRPSMESQFHAWNVEKPMRSNPLATEWGSLHSFSRSHSRRPSIYGSTSNLSLPQHADDDVIEPRRENTRPLQAPIGTRPTSSQRPVTPKLNPAAPSFHMFFSKRAEKSREKEKGRPRDSRDSRDKFPDPDTASPPESRKSKDTHSIAPTISTTESRDSLDRIMSTTSGAATSENTPVKPNFISKITRKASSNKFGSWKENRSLFSKRDASTPPAEFDEEHSYLDAPVKGNDSHPTTPNAEEKKSSRTSLANWSFMRKPKKGAKDDFATSEVSENSERASSLGGEDGQEDDRQPF